MEAIRQRAVTYALIAVCVAIFVADAVATNGASLGSAPSTLPLLLAPAVRAFFEPRSQAAAAI